ncbi:ribosomal protein [Hirsutella rhossiliensis]|uniref:Ribosomal protein l1p/L10e family domain-containing protein n=1 Tax=Hirsutella rhossiliensis TaxID=111463 RepID=A0A9P8N8L0_9HYPO|nr:ribosomal protein l1p/L10e family domain-containing protein [Hirsutella rhossiliensis]KAH0967976.1 ribosomal protein l1p/L10e family domain-containing protein [Hirsutella rhossiliensis]
MVQSRQASVVRAKKSKKKKKPLPKDFKRHNLEKREFPQFSLFEAMRILRAVEVGQPPSVKYEIHINLKTARNGPVIKNSVRLPNPVQSDWQIAVLCPEGSEIAAAAAAAGAVAVGEESLLEDIRQGKINFDRLICHESSEKALNKSGLGRVLGPKGLMPSKRMKTIVSDVVKSIRDSAGAADYRERQGVIRMPIGQLGHSADQLKANLTTLLKKIKSQCANISEESPKEVHEIILSTSHGPGLTLNGKVADASGGVTAEALSSVM